MEQSSKEDKGMKTQKIESSHVHNISDKISCRLESLSPDHDAGKLAEFTIESWNALNEANSFWKGSNARQNRFTEPTPSFMLSLPDIGDVFPELKDGSNEKGLKSKTGKPMTPSQLISRVTSLCFNFYIACPCKMCGEHEFSLKSTWTDTRNLLNPRADISFYLNPRPVEKMFSEFSLYFETPNTRWSDCDGWSNPHYPGNENSVLVEKEKIPVCDECERKIVLHGIVLRKIKEKSYAEESLATKKREEEFREKKRLFEEKTLLILWSHIPPAIRTGFPVCAVRESTRVIGFGEVCLWILTAISFNPFSEQTRFK